MPWAQRDDQSWTDPRLCALSHVAFRLHENCWTYSANRMTDGRVTEDEVKRVAAMFDVTDAGCLKKAIQELLDALLWDQDTTGYVMVDWLSQNRSRKVVLRDRKKNREKLAAWREKQAREASE